MDTPQVRKEMGKKLKSARERKNLTQAELASKAGLNTNYYACIERGEVNPSFSKIQSIVKALGITSSEIMPF
jgi:transcriptional regulator with XRE-family HTH domain